MMDFPNISEFLDFLLANHWILDKSMISGRYQHAKPLKTKTFPRETFPREIFPRVFYRGKVSQGILEFPGYPRNDGFRKRKKVLISVKIPGFLGYLSFMDIPEMMDFTNIPEILDFLQANLGIPNSSMISGRFPHASPLENKNFSPRN